MTKRTQQLIARLTKAHGAKTRISERTGIPLHSLSRILAGKRAAGPERANTLERELGVPASEFRRSA